MLWRWIISVLVWLSSDPQAARLEAPKAAAAVAAARASLAIDSGPAPAPAPQPGKCCGECKGTGFITHGDGHRTPCPCPPGCTCKGGKGCTDGTCRKPS